MSVVENPAKPLQSQLIKAWIFSQNADGTFSPATFSGGSGGGGNTNLTGINGSAPALTNPLAVELSDGTNPFGTSGNPLFTKSKITGNAGGIFDAITGAAVPANALLVGGTDGTDLRALSVDSTGKLNVNVSAIVADSVNQGSQGTIAQSWYTEVTDGTNVLFTSAHPGYVQGTVAATQSTSPWVVSGAVTSTDAASGPTGSAVPADASYNGSIASTSLPAAATAGNLVGDMSDKFGRGITTLNGMRDIIGTASVQNTGASGTLIGQIASTYCDIIQLILTNETATATVVSISDGTTTYKFALAANGGGVFTFPTPLPATSTNTNWTVSNSASSTVDCVAIYVKNK
jgi:hypothetical protein